MIELINGDCIKVMTDFIKQGRKFDAVITDPPFQTSAASWDIAIPFSDMWNCLRKLITDAGAIVLFAQQPFTSKLICSNLEMYKYNWVWQKDNATNFLNKRYQPGKITEDICVFGKMATSFSKKGNMRYYPQLTDGKAYKTTSSSARRTNAVIRSEIHNVVTDNNGTRLPNNILRFNRDKQKLHPTQKPVSLMEYLVKTYTQKGDTVLDFTMGSGSTGLACCNTDRNFVGIELDEVIFNIAKERIHGDSLFAETA